MYRTSISKDEVYMYGVWSAGKQIPVKVDRYQIRVVSAYGAKEVRMIHKKKIIMKLSLAPRKWNGMEIYHVNSAYLKRSYQGKGLGQKLYHTLIVNHGLTLYSNGSHSAGARKVWLRLSKMKDVQAYGAEFYDSKVWLLKSNSSGTELQSQAGNQSLYGNDSSSIILTKKGGVIDEKLASLLSKKEKKRKKPDILGTVRFETVYGSEHEY